MKINFEKFQDFLEGDNCFYNKV